MHILEVIPLTLLPQHAPQILSYLSPAALPKGAVVEISLGRRKVSAVVISATDMHEEKMTLKKSAFQIKNISRILTDSVAVSDMQFHLALAMTRTYAAPLSACLKAVLPPFFLKRGYRTLPFPAPQPHHERPFYITVPAQKTIPALQETIEHVIRHGGQVLVLAPDTTVIEYFTRELAHIHSPILISGSLSNPELFEAWQKTAGSASLIIGTRQALFAPYRNLKLIIVEDPRHEAYKSDMTPRYRTSTMAQILADTLGSEIVYTSSIPDVASYHAIKERTVIWKDVRPSTHTRAQIIDMSLEAQSGNFSSCSRALQQEIERIIEHKKQLLIFSSRKGYAGILSCENCGLIAKCPHCSAPLRVHTIPEPALMCHHCLKKIKFPDICSNCSSYKLKKTGLPGTHKITEEIERFVTAHPQRPTILTLDASLIQDRSDTEREMVALMRSARPLIVVASHMILSHRYDLTFDSIAVQSIDGIMSIPEYRSEEQMLYHLEKLNDFRPQRTLYQTYQPTHPALTAFVENDWQTLYETELTIRKTFAYPPFSTIAKLTYTHTSRAAASTASRILAEKLKIIITQLNLHQHVRLIGPTPAFIAQEKNRFTFHIILKIAPEEKLDRILKYVPAGWRIDIDPNEVL